MAGPYQPNQGTDPYPRPPLPYPAGYGMAPPPHYFPGPLPPPLPYPNRRRGRAVAVALAVLTLIAAAVVAMVLVTRDGAGPASGALTPGSAKQAIQGYLDALSTGDIQAISRNTLCGLYGGVRDRRTDDALVEELGDLLYQIEDRS